MEFTAYNILQTSRLLKYTMDKALKGKGVTASQFSVLNQIDFKDQTITSAEIAEKLGSDRPTMSGIIRRLETGGFLIRIENPNDRRATYLGLTQRGKDIIGELRSIADALTQDVFSVLDGEELEHFQISLSKVMTKLENSLASIEGIKEQQ